MNIKVWGARGSIPAPGPLTQRYGGNTSCLELTLSDGTKLILDAGSGARALGGSLAESGVKKIHLLLTHLHLDHVMGLMFFAPCFSPDTELVIWGPPAAVDLRERLARYISEPLAPLAIEDLPSQVSFKECPDTPWEIGSARISASPVTHRGATLGFRVEDGGATFVYMPDHEPGISSALEEGDRDWISGLELASGADLLIHDCQYTDAQYPHHVGWGHSRVTDALAFARLADARRVLLFHHDPAHDDETLDRLHEMAVEGWESGGRDGAEIGMAQELQELRLNGSGPVL